MSDSCSRRDFLSQTSSCAAHLALAAAALPGPLRARWAQAVDGVVAREPFGALQRLADGIWALVSTPLLGDRTTVCNGGLIAGRSGVLAIEGFMQPAGAAWLAGKARELTGRWPTHVVVTHHHADHVNGVAGYRDGDRAPLLHASTRTRELALSRNLPADASRTAALRDATAISADAASRIDLGGRTVRVVPRDGHTPSDVTLELDDPSVVFCGDLVWNAMFPNYVDAMPGALARSVRALRRQRPTTYVPGHGPVARGPELDRYEAVLAEVERAARAAHARGQPPAEAAATFALPPSLGEWALFNRIFYERAFAAWEKELVADDA